MKRSRFEAKLAAISAPKLREYASRNGIANASRMKKSQIIAKLTDMKRAADASWNQNIIGSGGYSATDARRKILSRGRAPTRMTANELAMSSLNQLRNYCRSLDRNNPQARAAVDGLVALVVGTGIALEPDTGSEVTDAKIRAEWKRYIESVTVDGRDLYELQTQGFREMVTAGELLWRIVFMDERSKAGMIPLSIMPLEAEWLDDQSAGSIVYSPGPDGTVEVGAITMDKYGRPIKYRLRNPETNSMWPAETVPATAIIHVFEKRRSMQIRGEPWMCPTIETLYQDRDLVDAELQSAITASSIGLAITSQHHDLLDDGTGDNDSDGTTDDPAQSLRLGAVARLYPGEDVKAFAHDRPGQQIMPFRQGLRGDIAACMRVSQRFLDRDASRANYSSMRADMLDTERLLGPVREFFGHGTIGRIYKEVLPFLCIRAGIPVPERKSYRLLPDAQPYVDPYKDAQAAAMSIASGLSTWEYEIGKRGGDYRQVWEQLRKEQEEAKKMGITIDLSGTNAPAPQLTAGKDPEAPAEQGSGSESETGSDDASEDTAESTAPEPRSVVQIQRGGKTYNIARNRDNTISMKVVA